VPGGPDDVAGVNQWCYNNLRDAGLTGIEARLSEGT